MQDLIDRLVRAEIVKLSLKDKMTGFLVKKKKRGTYQAFTECSAIENKITQDLLTYIKEWYTNELLDGSLRKLLNQEIYNQVKLELYRNGFNDILD